MSSAKAPLLGDMASEEVSSDRGIDDIESLEGDSKNKNGHFAEIIESSEGDSKNRNGHFADATSDSEGRSADIKRTSSGSVIHSTPADSKITSFTKWLRAAVSRFREGVSSREPLLPLRRSRPGEGNRLRGAVLPPEPVLPVGISSPRRGEENRRRETVSSPPLLPVQNSSPGEEKEKVASKLQVLYAVALAAPIPLLASAAALKLFPGYWAFVAATGVGVWIVASSGMVINQYSESYLEDFFARHLGHLDVLSSAVLFSFYAFKAFFPESVAGLGVLLALSVISLGVPWILGCWRRRHGSPSESEHDSSSQSE